MHRQFHVISSAPKSHARPQVRGTRRFARASSAALVVLACLTHAFPAEVVAAPGSLAWQQGDGFRRAAVASDQPGQAGFTLLTPTQTGVLFTNVLAQSRYITNQIYLNGAGVAAGDVDGDGLTDLYFCGLDRPNVLYRNRGGFAFEDITATAGVGLTNHSSTGATFADIDGDGDLDLLVNSVGNGTVILLNDGAGRFRDPQPGAPLNFLKGGMSLALADVDGDGDLDLYIANYRTTTIRDMPNTRLTIQDQDGQLVVTAVNGRPAAEPDLAGRYRVTRDQRIIENGEVDVLYANDGKGGFTVMPFLGGGFLDEDGKPLKEPPYDWGLTATFRDINGDGAPDIYVCNDFESPDRVWLNDGKGRFRAIDRLAIRTTSIFSMGVDFADINRDGFDDFFLSDMLSRDHARRMLETGEVQPVHLPVGSIDNRPQYSHNTLFLNRGDGTYAELSQFAGVEASEWTWSPNFLDVDLDGYEDLLITTGHELQMMNGDIIQRAETMKTQKQMSNYELQKLRTMFPRHSVPKVAFRNRGDLTFEDMSAKWGFSHPDVSNAVTIADLDNDGDLDVVVNNLNGLAEIYRNDGTAPRVAVRLRGLPHNTQGIGAKIKVLGGAVPMQSQEVVCGGRYLSGNDPVRVFAAGSRTNRLTIEVTWRGGRRSVLLDALADSVYEIHEAGAKLEAEVTPPAPAPLFEDASDLIHHRHVEEPFDDFARQPLLPRNLSQQGPGMAWADLNADGWDDLVVGAGKGGQLAVFLGSTNGTFTRRTEGGLSRPVGRDQTAVLAVPPTLIVGSSNYEDGTTNGGCIRIYDTRRQAAGESIIGQGITTGPLAMADVDGDGGLDLFVGGRAIPGRYPEPATSLFLKKEGERFVVTQRFDKLGLISGAVFSDLTGDGRPELILACEWGPVRVFRWEGKAFREVTKDLGFDRFTGLWNGVATGDLDGDGRLDIVASNWGLNSRHRPTPAQPMRIHYADFDESGTLDVVESYIDPARGQEVPWRSLRPIVAGMPFMQDKAASFEAYGKATLAELYGDKLQTAAVVEANTLASMVFLNRGDHFEARLLPSEAQWAPAFGVCVADLDGDGAEDVFLSQNFFAVRPDDWRQDAGRGLLLKGDGHGGLRPMPGKESGIAVYGEQRGCAVSDYDGDGRLDLAVSQNANATKLYHNRRATPGLRVRVVGSQGNPLAVGATLRTKAGDRLGPAREIQCGSGYWSQNSPVQVVSLASSPSQLQVRWPGGGTTESAIPSGAQEILINTDGSVRVVR